MKPESHSHFGPEMRSFKFSQSGPTNCSIWFLPIFAQDILVHIDWGPGQSCLICYCNMPAPHNTNSLLNVVLVSSVLKLSLLLPGNTV